MGEIIHFPGKNNADEDLPILKFCDSIPELVEKAVSYNLIVKCAEIDAYVVPRETPEDAIYRVVFLTPSGEKARFELLGFQLKTFLNGMLLAYAILQHKQETEVSF